MKIGEMSKCTFRSGCGKLVGTMHRDDVLISWPRSIVEKVRRSLRKCCQTRKQGGRADGVQRHAAKVIEELGLGASKPVCTTAHEMTEDEIVTLEGAAASQFRRLAVKLNCLSLDRPDIRCGTSLGCSVASKPPVRVTIRPQRIARFLVGKPLLWTYFRAARQEAACRRTRRGGR